MRLLSRTRASLWVIVISYYAMFYAANAVLLHLGYRTGEKIAHKVTSDALIVLVLEKLYELLLDKIMKEEKVNEEKAVEMMIDISSRPSLMNMFNFGKYNGKTVQEVANIDRGYLEWMLGQKEQNSDNEEDWIYTLKYYLGKLV